MIFRFFFLLFHVKHWLFFNTFTIDTDDIYNLMIIDENKLVY